jgi:hypothetical protein
MKRIVFSVSFVLLMGVAACQEGNVVEAPGFSVAVINSTTLPHFKATQAVYFYQYSQVNPEPLLLELLHAGIPVYRAWLPLDNHCMDIIGARFTVELAAVDERMAEFGFAKGEGRLSCASKLKQFTITK